MPKISFVMPTKNRSKIIIDSINSILNQTEKDWELIVVDDHSDIEDNTEEIINKLNDNRIKYIRMPDKWAGGIPNARNFGNIYANSSIIAVADSDDISSPKRAMLTLEAFEKHNCDVFYGNLNVLFKENNEIKDPRNPIIEINQEEMKKRNIIPHGSSAYKREIAYEYPYNSFFLQGEDYDLFTRLLDAKKKFYFSREKIYTYIVHGENLTGGKKTIGYDDLIKINRKWDMSDKARVLESIINNYQ